MCSLLKAMLAPKRGCFVISASLLMVPRLVVTPPRKSTRMLYVLVVVFFRRFVGQAYVDKVIREPRIFVGHGPSPTLKLLAPDSSRPVLPLILLTYMRNRKQWRKYYINYAYVRH